MLTFNLSVLLIPYAIIIAIILFFAIVNIKNLVRYRAEEVGSFFALFIFLAGLFVIAYISFIYLAPIDWKEQIDIGVQFGARSF